MHCVKNQDPGGNWRCKLHHPLILNKNDSLIGSHLSPSECWNYLNHQTRKHCNFSCPCFAAKNDNIVKLRPVRRRELKTITIQQNTVVFVINFDPEAFLIKLYTLSSFIGMSSRENRYRTPPAIDLLLLILSERKIVNRSGNCL